MAENTPIIRPSMIRKAARYCATRLVTEFHAAMITGTVMKVVSRISGSAMPSTPRW